MNTSNKQLEAQEALEKLLVHLKKKTVEQETLIRELEQLLEKENYGKF